MHIERREGQEGREGMHEETDMPQASRTNRMAHIVLGGARDNMNRKLEMHGEGDMVQIGQKGIVVIGLGKRTTAQILESESGQLTVNESGGICPAKRTKAQV
jgi:N-dimethylarginine dimethylaminohydrolase